MRRGKSANKDLHFAWIKKIPLLAGGAPTKLVVLLGRVEPFGVVRQRQPSLRHVEQQKLLLRHICPLRQPNAFLGEPPELRFDSRHAALLADA